MHENFQIVNKNASRRDHLQRPLWRRGVWIPARELYSHFKTKHQRRQQLLRVSFRHVTLPAELAKLVPRNHLMTETEWRNLGHFLIYLHSILCISHGLGQRENRIIEMQIWMVKRGKVWSAIGIQRQRLDISSDRRVLLGLLQILRFAVVQAFRFFIQVFSKVLAGSTTCFTLPSPRFSIVP